MVATHGFVKKTWEIPKKEIVRAEELRKKYFHAYHVGEAIKQARLSKNLTQKQLGEKVGVQKAQISRLERGKSISLASMIRVFRAMGIPLTLEVGNIGRVALW